MQPAVIKAANWCEKRCALIVAGFLNPWNHSWQGGRWFECTCLTAMPARDPDGTGRHNHNFSFSSFPWKAGVLSHACLGIEFRWPSRYLLPISTISRPSPVAPWPNSPYPHKPWYVSVVSIIFDCSMLLYYHSWMLYNHFITPLYHFLGLTYWHSAQCELLLFACLLLCRISVPNGVQTQRNFLEIFLD